MADVDFETPGFYGKLPARGDFVSRHLPRSFLDPWDDWLQTAMATSRQRLEERWLECYLTSPLWRFALSPGLCGEDAYAGVLMPSVDRVGRYYPLLIAVSIKDTGNLLDLAENGGTWFQRAEEVILTGLDDHLNLDDFTAQVQALGSPLALMTPTKSTAPELADGLTWYCPLDNPTGFNDIRSALTEYLLQRCFSCYSLWWSHGSEHIVPCLLMCQGLPPSEGFAALLAGNWSQLGWQEKPLSIHSRSQ